MARGNNNGWDFIKTGELYQYKESHAILVVEVLKDYSTDSEYSFLLKPIASTVDLSEEFIVTHNKKSTGAYNGQVQLYETPEYLMMPIGSSYPFIYDKEKLNNSHFIWEKTDED